MRKNLKDKIKFYVEDLSVIYLIICGVFFNLMMVSAFTYLIIKNFM